MSTVNEPSSSIDLYADTQTAQYQNDDRLHSDADSIRRYFGVNAYERDRYRFPHVFPNMLEHVWDGDPVGAEQDKGGTDCLIRGKPGRGKSTLLLHLSLRLLEINNEKVVWRGSTTRSEWLPFAPWTKLCLPEGVDVSARLEPKDPTDDVIDDVDLTDVVREVVRYKNPEHLNREILTPGQFHVVMPDPQMQGCQRIYEEASEKEYEDLEFGVEDPDNHWWFAWLLARTELGPHDWTTLIFDEIGDLAPQSARKDDYGSYQKVELLKDVFVDARKFGLSLFTAGHTEQDIHQMIRHKIRWRIQTPQESNPTSKNDIVGFNQIPMETDIMSNAQIGTILAYNERNFEKLSYPHYPSPVDYSLKISMET